VNPVDTYIRSGQYGVKPELPYTPGFDGAGEVVEVSPAGATPAAWPRAGERVWVGKRGRDGTYAEYVVCEPEQVHPLPERLSFAQGAGVYVACCTAWRALFSRGGARAGETVLIHGASGGVGLAAVELASAAGLRVFGTAGTPAGAQAVRAAGAHLVVNHRDASYLAEIAAASRTAWPGRVTSGGVDLIVEMLASTNLQRDLDLIAPRGRVVIVGSRGSLDFNPRAAMGKEATVMGMSLMNLTAAEAAEVYAGVQVALDRGTLTPRIAHELPLADAAKAHDLVLSTSGHAGKIVLSIP
jgi:NADPH2:quinone reductase